MIPKLLDFGLVGDWRRQKGRFSEPNCVAITLDAQYLGRYSIVDPSRPSPLDPAMFVPQAAPTQLGPCFDSEGLQTALIP